jgi:hypothetical protein
MVSIMLKQVMDMYADMPSTTLSHTLSIPLLSIPVCSASLSLFAALRMQDFGSELVRQLLQTQNTTAAISGTVLAAEGVPPAAVTQFLCAYDDFCGMVYNISTGQQEKICSGTNFKELNYVPPPCNRVQALGTVDQPGQSIPYSSDEIAQPLGSVILPAQPAQPAEPAQPAQAPADTITSTLGSIIQPFLASFKKPAQTAKVPAVTTAQDQDAQGFEEVNS